LLPLQLGFERFQCGMHTAENRSSDVEGPVQKIWWLTIRAYARWEFWD